MTEKMLMLDIETTGIDPACEDLLQIGMLEMTWEKDHWEGGKQLSYVVFSNRAPVTSFAREHMKGLYELCNVAPRLNVRFTRRVVLDFAQSCGQTPPNLRFCGWNAGIFDVPFLVAKGVLKPTGYKTVDGQDVRIGDFHYRIYDLQAALRFVADAFGVEVAGGSGQTAVAGLAKNPYQCPLPDGKTDHDALYDCVKQLNLLNDLLATVRSRFKEA
jgi:hypothetical protein